MRAMGWASFAALLCAALPARADDVSWQGFIDARLVAPSDGVSWLKGGLGKLRYGSDSGGTDVRFAEAIGEASWHVTPDLTLTATLRVEPDQRSGVDALEAYARYHPQAIGDWQWSIKAGAFFPPISLENEDVGWTSPYTLTPSAIDSWVGDELRTIGAEAELVRRTDWGIFTATAALFCCNDPAGILIAERGWTLDDRPTGLFETVREPNESLVLLQRDAPDRTSMFLEIDGHPGWYGGGAWEIPGWGRAQVLYYDNESDPAAYYDEDYSAWHTRFWSEGLRTNVGDATFLFQNLAGSTTAQFQSSSRWTTAFWSAYALGSYDLDDWRFAVRGDLFGTGQDRAFWQPFGEHGRAVTASASWSPKDWLRLTGEFIALDAQRPEREAEGLSKEEVDDQFQLNVRVSF
jgi:hypothetical protein